MQGAGRWAQAAWLACGYGRAGRAGSGRGRRRSRGRGAAAALGHAGGRGAQALGRAGERHGMGARRAGGRSGVGGSDARGAQQAQAGARGAADWAACVRLVCAAGPGWVFWCT